MESVLDAIRNGQWDYEPDDVSELTYEPTPALPGTEEKVTVLADRARRGLPLWHSSDRRSYDDSENTMTAKIR
jgi:hypothetical protein